MAGITKFYTISERAINKLRHKGFTASELDGFQTYPERAEMIVSPFTIAVEKIKTDRNLSEQGKAARLQALKEETAGKLNTLIAGTFDKSQLINNYEVLSKTKVARFGHPISHQTSCWHIFSNLRPGTVTPPSTKGTWPGSILQVPALTTRMPTAPWIWP